MNKDGEAIAVNAVIKLLFYPRDSIPYFIITMPLIVQQKRTICNFATLKWAPCKIKSRYLVFSHILIGKDMLYNPGLHC
jgi:hypothetical protein